MGLLDGPRLPGLFGDPRWEAMVRPNANLNLRPMHQPPPPPPSRMDRIGNALSQAFGGANDPRLGAAENDAARKQAMLQAGLAGLIAANQPGASALGSIAQGLMYGQQAGAQGREQAFQRQTEQQTAEAKKQRQDRLRAAIGSGQIDRAALERLMVEAIIAGDTEASGDLSEVIKSMGGQQANAAAVRGSPEWLAARRAELELEREFAGPKAPIPGTPEYTAMLEERARIAAKYRPAARTAAGSEGERKAAAFAGMVADGTSYIDQIESAPGRVEQALSDKGIREFADDEQQQLALAGNALAEAWLRMTTGAAYNDREFANAYNLFVPKPGDRKASLEWKRKNRQRLQEMIRTHSGRLAPTEEQPDDFDPFEGL